MTQRPAQGMKSAMAKAGITKPQRCKTNKPNVMKLNFFPGGPALVTVHILQIVP
jgi:hypothetical protein